ncbi:MAG: hypothetical protein AAFW47_06265 [Pseudomonadota bacterium]
MTILRNFPLLVIPLIIYNLYAWGILPASEAIWSDVIADFNMISGEVFALTRGGALIAFALAILFIEILKATRTAQATIIDHLLSTLVFVIYLVQLIIDGNAATTTFFLCTLIAFLDVVAGYSISIRVASRDVTFERGL